jgi:hypothetical protein
MSIIDRLRWQHQALERELQQLLARRALADRTRIAWLKKRKLAIKDQIALLMKGPRPIPIAI